MIKKSETYFKSGQAHYNLGKFDQAARDVAKSIELDPDNLGKYRFLSKVYCFNGDHSGQITCTSQILKLKPDDPWAYQLRGIAYYFKNKYSSAIADLTKSIEFEKKEKNNSRTYEWRGNAYFRSGEWAKGIVDYQEAIRLDPSPVITYTSLAIECIKIKKYDEAINILTKRIRRGVRRNPTYALLYGHRGIAYEEKGEYCKAIKDFRRAAEFDPKFEGYRSNLKRVLGKKSPRSIPLKEKMGTRELEEAISKKDLIKVKSLIAAGADVNARTGKQKNGYTALMYAVEKGSASIAKILIEAGADVNLESSGVTALWLAARNGHHDIVKFLIAAGAKVNVTPDKFESAINSAAWNGHTGTVKILQAAGAKDDDRTKNLEKIGRFIKAVTDGNIVRVNKLIQAGADVNVRDHINSTPLMTAATYGYTAIVKSLIAAGADVNAKDEFGITPLLIAYGAAGKEYRKIRKILKASGAQK